MADDGSLFVLGDYVVDTDESRGTQLPTTQADTIPADSNLGIEWAIVDVPRPEKEAVPAKPKKRLKYSRSKSTATVGGVDYSFGGWGEYEAERRKAEREVRGGGESGGAPDPVQTYYAGRTFVGGKDVAESLLSARVPRAMRKAADHLSKSLGNLEDTLCNPDDSGLWQCTSPSTLVEPKRAFRAFPSIVVPPLTSEDVDAFIKNGDFMSPDDLYLIADDAIATAAAIKQNVRLPPAFKGHAFPPLPARVVPTKDEAAVAKLELAALPYVSRIEELQSAVASILDTVASAIDKALAKN